MIKIVEGNLLINAYDAEAFAHGCNCVGVMGAGIAKQLKKYYPGMFDAYKKAIRDEQFGLGRVAIWGDKYGFNGRRITIFCLGTQPMPGPSANLWAIRRSLLEMRETMDTLSIRSVALPKIGCGYGGLSWDVVKPIVDETLGDWLGTAYVYEKYVP